MSLLRMTTRHEHGRRPSRLAVVIGVSACMTWMMIGGVGAQHSLRESWEGSSFFEHFKFSTGPARDGRATYVGYSQASAAGLVSSTTDVMISADSWSTVPEGGLRSSVELTSAKTFSRGSFVTFDAAHVPTGCGVSAGVWLSGSDGSRIDVVSGVNNAERSRVVLRTAKACDQGTAAGMPAYFKGTFEEGTTKCDSARGCVVNAPKGTAGKEFNAATGGVYALLWEDDEITAWFWPRASVPADVAEGSPIAYSAEWGLPVARFDLSDTAVCGADALAEMRLVIGLNLCDSWSAADPSCNAKACPEVSELSEAYWRINGIKVYDRVVSQALRTIREAEVTSSAVPSAMSSGVVCSSLNSSTCLDYAGACSWCQSSSACQDGTGSSCAQCSIFTVAQCGTVLAPGCGWCSAETTCKDVGAACLACQGADQASCTATARPGCKWCQREATCKETASKCLADCSTQIGRPEPYCRAEACTYCPNAKPTENCIDPVFPCKTNCAAYDNVTCSGMTDCLWCRVSAACLSQYDTALCPSCSALTQTQCLANRACNWCSGSCTEGVCANVVANVDYWIAQPLASNIPLLKAAVFEINFDKTVLVSTNGTTHSYLATDKLSMAAARMGSDFSSLYPKAVKTLEGSVSITCPDGRYITSLGFDTGLTVLPAVDSPLGLFYGSLFSATDRVAPRKLYAVLPLTDYVAGFSQGKRVHMPVTLWASDNFAGCTMRFSTSHMKGVDEGALVQPATITKRTLTCNTKSFVTSFLSSYIAASRPHPWTDRARELSPVVMSAPDLWIAKAVHGLSMTPVTQGCHDAVAKTMLGYGLAEKTATEGSCNKPSVILASTDCIKNRGGYDTDACFTENSEVFGDACCDAGVAGCCAPRQVTYSAPAYSKTAAVATAQCKHPAGSAIIAETLHNFTLIESNTDACWSQMQEAISTVKSTNVVQVLMQHCVSLVAGKNGPAADRPCTSTNYATTCFVDDATACVNGNCRAISEDIMAEMLVRCMAHQAFTNVDFKLFGDFVLTSMDQPSVTEAQMATYLLDTLTMQGCTGYNVTASLEQTFTWRCDEMGLTCSPVAVKNNTQLLESCVVQRGCSWDPKLSADSCALTAAVCMAGPVGDGARADSAPRCVFTDGYGASRTRTISTKHCEVLGGVSTMLGECVHTASTSITTCFSIAGCEATMAGSQERAFCESSSCVVPVLQADCTGATKIWTTVTGECIDAQYRTLESCATAGGYWYQGKSWTAASRDTKETCEGEKVCVGDYWDLDDAACTSRKVCDHNCPVCRGAPKCIKSLPECASPTTFTSAACIIAAETKATCEASSGVWANCAAVPLDSCQDYMAFTGLQCVLDTESRCPDAASCAQQGTCNGEQGCYFPLPNYKRSCSEANYDESSFSPMVCFSDAVDDVSCEAKSGVYVSTTAKTQTACESVHVCSVGGAAQFLSEDLTACKASCGATAASLVPAFTWTAGQMKNLTLTSPASAFVRWVLPTSVIPSAPVNKVSRVINTGAFGMLQYTYPAAAYSPIMADYAKCLLTTESAVLPVLKCDCLDKSDGCLTNPAPVVAAIKTIPQVLPPAGATFNIPNPLTGHGQIRLVVPKSFEGKNMQIMVAVHNILQLLGIQGSRKRAAADSNVVNQYNQVVGRVLTDGVEIVIDGDNQTMPGAMSLCADRLSALNTGINSTFNVPDFAQYINGSWVVLRTNDTTNGTTTTTICSSITSGGLYFGLLRMSNYAEYGAPTNSTDYSADDESSISSIQPLPPAPKKSNAALLALLVLLLIPIAVVAAVVVWQLRRKGHKKGKRVHPDGPVAQKHKDALLGGQ